jgi:hypothetical protein
MRRPQAEAAMPGSAGAIATAEQLQTDPREANRKRSVARAYRQMLAMSSSRLALVRDGT